MSVLQNFKLAHIRRDANKVAHDIAKSCYSIKFDGLLVGGVPSYVMNGVVNDCMNIS